MPGTNPQAGVRAHVVLAIFAWGSSMWLSFLSGTHYGFKVSAAVVIAGIHFAVVWHCLVHGRSRARFMLLVLSAPLLYFTADNVFRRLPHALFG